LKIPNIQEFYFPIEVECPNYSKALWNGQSLLSKNLNWHSLKIIHFPLFPAGGDYNKQIIKLVQKCRVLEEIGLRIHECIDDIAINDFFKEGPDSLKRLILNFEDPYCDLERAEDMASTCPRISEETLGRLEKLEIYFNSESTVKGWISFDSLFSSAEKLLELTIKRRLKFKTMLKHRSKTHMYEESSYSPPSTLPLAAIRLRKLTIINYLQQAFIGRLIRENRDLSYFKLRRKNLPHGFQFGDSPSLQTLDIKLGKPGSYVYTGSLLSLTTLKMDCQLSP